MLLSVHFVDVAIQAPSQTAHPPQTGLRELPELFTEVTEDLLFRGIKLTYKFQKAVIEIKKKNVF